MKLSVITVNWNTKEMTLSCLRTVFDQTKHITLEYIVIDNASSDGSAEAIGREFPVVKLIRNKKNLGFAKANNQGLKLAQGDYIVLLSSDIFVLDSALEKMASFMGSSPGIGACSPMLVDKNGSTQPAAAKFPTLFDYFNEYIFGEVSAWYPIKEYQHNMEVDSVIGACLMVRKNVLREVGMLSEEYFMYSEDVDWCYRIKKAGWKIFYLAEAKVVHLGGGSSKKVKKEMEKAILNSRIIFFRNYHSSVEVLVLKLFMIVGQLRTGLKRLVTA